MNLKPAGPRPVERLETALRMWEETLLLAQASFTYGASLGDTHAKKSLAGSVINGQMLRKELLARRPISQERFSTPDSVVDSYFMKSPVFNILPFMIQTWTMTSRRVYDLSEDFQRSLELTSIGKIAWQDITPPFPTFGMSLPLPIPWETAGMKGTIDFVLVDFSPAGACFIGLGEELNGRKFIPAKKRHRIMRAIRDKEFGILRGIIHGLTEGNFALPATHMVSFPMDERPIMEDMADVDFDTLVAGEIIPAEHNTMKLPEFWQLIIRMAVGLCLHLEMLDRSKRDPEIRTEAWRKHGAGVATTVDEQAITDEAMVCAVKLVNPLGLEERSYHEQIRAIGIKSATRELPAHFRRTYWRRGPGTGHDPDAPKWVKVKHTWVNRHRLPAEGLPSGSEVPVK